MLARYPHRTGTAVAYAADAATHSDLRALAARLHHVREEERAHLARELHDHFGQTLTALKLALAGLLRPAHLDRDSLEGQVDAMSAMCDGIIRDVRKVSESLRPSVLDNLGLAAAIKWHAKSFAECAGVPCAADICDSGRKLPRNQATAVYRIFQEALTNVARHAGATRVDVVLRLSATEVFLLVVDDGTGFVMDARLEGSLGLLGMQERAIAWGGEMAVQSRPGQGTRIMASMPLGKDAAERNNDLSEASS